MDTRLAQFRVQENWVRYTGCLWSLVSVLLFRIREVQFERLNDSLHDRVLNCKDVVQFTVIALRPDMPAGRRVDDPSVVSPHTMRHSAITRFALIGADIKTIQEFSGHESLEMVLRYAHAQDQAIDSALDRLEGRTVIEHPRARKHQDS